MIAARTRALFAEMTAVVVVLTAVLVASGAALPDPPPNPHQDSLLEYASSGHVLAFNEESVIIASASHMVKTGFVDANRVAPRADDGE